MNSTKLFKLARALYQMNDQDDDNIHVLIDPYLNMCPCYITYRLNENSFDVIKIKPYIEITKQFNDMQKLSQDIIKCQNKYSDKIKRIFQWRKNLNINELRKELLYGQLSLDPKHFELLYDTIEESQLYKGFKIYLLTNRYKIQQIKKLIDIVQSKMGTCFHKINNCNLNIKDNIELNRIAQYDINFNLIQIKDLNIHAFIHQLGHKWWHDYLTANLRQGFIRLIKKYNHVPSRLCLKNEQEYFAELFAFYFEDKIDNKEEKQEFQNLIVYKKLKARMAYFYTDFNKAEFIMNQTLHKLYIFKKTT